MTTPQQFLEDFLKERAAAFALSNARLAPLYARCFGEPLSQHAEDLLLRDNAAYRFELVTESGDSACIITRERLGTTDLRMRYRLAVLGEDWKIVHIDWECFLCRGTGRRKSGAASDRCGGEGWYDPRKLKS